jgi:subtilisin family serine protease
MNKTICLLFLAWCILLPGLAHGQVEEPQQIHLHSGSIDPLRDGTPAAGSTGLAASTATPLMLVQFRGPVQAAWTDALTRQGAELLGYIPDHTFLVRAAPESITRIQALDAVRWVGPYAPAYKLAPDLAAPTTGLAAVPASREVLVVGFAGDPVADLQALLREAGATLHEARATAIGPLVRATLPAAALDSLAQHAAVSWIEPYHAPEMTTIEARQIMQVASAWEERDLFGAGQIVSIADSGLSVDGALNADFAGRLLRAFTPAEMSPDDPECAAKTNWTDLNGHGTHVAGSLLGNGHNSRSAPEQHTYSGSLAGVAPEARLVFLALNTDGGTGLQCIPYDDSFLARGYDAGARIASNSWGAAGRGTYTLRSQIVDRYIWEHPDYLVLFSAGNMGDFNLDGVPDTQIIGAPGTAKNVLTVGASENLRPGLRVSPYGDIADDPDTLAYFSSRGPTADGRIKPDIVAPGTSIVSVRAASATEQYPPYQGNPNYTASSGTSMSTPLVAGSAALVREWLITEGANLTPSAALLKALLIHGAAPLGTTAHPNSASGWGRADVARTLDSTYTIIDDDQFGITTGSTRVYRLQVDDTDQTERLAATLTWTDPPSHSAAAQTLVNNLDLTVEAPDGTRWFGNGGSAPDTRNNVETVRLDTLTAGTYTIRVHADNVVGTYGPQPFALLVGTETRSTTFNEEPRQQTHATGNSPIFLPLVAR